MLKNLLKLVIIAPLLIATTCENDPIEDRLVHNVYKANVSQEYSYSLNDTIWIEGRISNQVFNATENDSIFLEEPYPDDLSIYKFIEPTTVSNCKDAIDAFEVILDQGQLSFLPSCENGKLQAYPEFEENVDFYTYRIGLKPTTQGDFVISWRDGLLQNLERHEFIADNYPIEDHPNQIGFNSCGEVSFRYLNESDREFYFTVE
ncbi:hypothetical protein DFQ11_10611 [Winogradskyella epiphytica]|uniref:Uncharacterized protein n=1 Tax=Winogradskyella epiphytica TaxID=262005 RepID=A0A2V4X576_9FLAO|nr:hypothetical protein [Winogradskyella epiphytica]PYE80214.1 hypothetical protein DFQ11_10611 [Winogradskyella epiphytica]GGW69811.1 hypothetical protein GCM10008085_22160 [Winogradskyella epiphytica]